MQMLVGVVVGFVAWMLLWLGAESVLSAIWPEWFGAHQRAFQAAITNGVAFTPDPAILVIHVALAAVMAACSGLIAARLAQHHPRAPLSMGLVLMVMGLMKAAMSWSLVPMWYHVSFTAVLLMMAVVGGRLIGGRAGGL